MSCCDSSSALNVGALCALLGQLPAGEITDTTELFVRNGLACERAVWPPMGGTWYSDEGVPDPLLGVDGDFYLDGSNVLYKKILGTWVSLGDLTGPQGPAGVDSGSAWKFNANTADVVVTGADTYLPSTALIIGGRVKAGTVLRWKLFATKTAAGVATPTFTVRFGTAGTIADTARLQFTGVAQTAATDTMFVELEVIIRSVSILGVVQASFNMHHFNTTTGVANKAQEQIFNGLSAAFNNTASALTVGLSVNPGAAGVWTYQHIAAEAFNLVEVPGAAAPADVGDVKATARATAPPGWLIADGAAVSRVTYADLFAEIGILFGVGDGSTTFNLPDLRSRAIIGIGYDEGGLPRTRGTVVGAETHKLTDAESGLPGHTHTQVAHDHTVDVVDQSLSNGAVANRGLVTQGGGPRGSIMPTVAPVINAVAAAAAVQNHNNMQPSMALLWVIKF